MFNELSLFIGDINMIQFRRGKTASWLAVNTPKLADGQPGYDKDKHKLKIGEIGTNGKAKSWSELPYVSGLFAEEILDSEFSATDETLFTYGTAAPTGTTKGKIYLQQFDGAVEADFVVETGRNVNYFYRKWNSGFMECWGYGVAPTGLFTDTVYSTNTGGYFEVKGFWK
jgi:hypothetical protein